MTHDARTIKEPETIALTPAKMAHLLNLPVRTIYRLICDGTITAIRVGRLFRITDSEMRSFLQRAKWKPDGGKR